MTTEIVKSEPSVKSLLESPQYSGRLRQLLGERSGQFVTSVIQISQQYQLQKCNPHSVIAAALTAASLDLPIHPSLGFAWVVPYKDRAAFQIGYKGLVQLANRSGLYKRLNVADVYEGELLKYDRVRGDVVIDETKRKGDTIVGYVAFFELTNGAEHAEYWPVDAVKAHAQRFSQAYRADKKDSPWFTDFHAMARKTVLTSLLKHWGPMSIQMERGFISDNTVQANVDAVPEIIDDHPEQDTPKQPQFTGRRGRKPKESEVVTDGAKGPSDTEPRTEPQMGSIPPGTTVQVGAQSDHIRDQALKSPGLVQPLSKREAIVKEFTDAGVSFDDITDYLVNQGLDRGAKSYPSWDEVPERVIELFAASPLTVPKLKKLYGKTQQQ